MLHWGAVHLLNVLYIVSLSNKVVLAMSWDKAFHLKKAFDLLQDKEKGSFSLTLVK